MKRIVTLIVALALGLAFSGPAVAEEITIVGTGSGATILKAIGEAFTRSNAGVVVNVPKSIGSGGGIKAVGTDENVIGRVARKIKEKEKHYGLTYIPLVKMPIVFFVNKSVGVQGLTTQQVCSIYSGEITNWKEVGGKNAMIRVVRREDGDSSLTTLLASLPGFKDITITAKSKTTFSDPSTFDLVEEKADTIAFGAYSDARYAEVNILTIGGKGPTDFDYPYVGTLALIFKEKNRTGTIGKFIEFATSPAAHDAINGAGGLPL